MTGGVKDLAEVVLPGEAEPGHQLDRLVGHRPHPADDRLRVRIGVRQGPLQVVKDWQPFPGDPDPLLGACLSQLAVVALPRVLQLGERSQSLVG